MVYIKNEIPFKNWVELQDDKFQTLWITFRPKRLPRHIPCIILGAIYHPPSANDYELGCHISASLDALLSKHPGAAIILLGDFNQFKDRYIKSSFNLKQIVSKPSRNDAILDCIYTNIKDYYGVPSILPPIGLSDHRVIISHPRPGIKQLESTITYQ